MDRVDVSQRSRNMRAVGSKDTAPETVVRELAHKLGYRFRLHRKDFPGRPDLVFPRLRTAIFVHGCFWHMHENCKKGKPPTSNIEFWSRKLTQNVERDLRSQGAIRDMGWSVEVVWECETKNKIALFEKLKVMLESRDFL